VLTVENPDPAFPATEENDRGLVLRIECPGLALLVTGDASGSVLEAWVKTAGRRGAQVVSAGHHGSATSTPDRLLAVLRPRAVLISVGRWNRFGHPSPSVLERVARSHAALLRTDRDGTIYLERRHGTWCARGQLTRRTVTLETAPARGEASRARAGARVLRAPVPHGIRGGSLAGVSDRGEER